MRKIHLLTILIIAIILCGCPSDEGNVEDLGDVSNKAAPDVTVSKSLQVCSFNIQFLGSSTSRDDVALSSILKDYDIVVIQELVAPPYEGTFPNGTPFRPDSEATEFFDEMKSLGFEYVLSEEDTGTGDKNHYNSSATEWWVTFYKPKKVKTANDLPSGFLAGDRTNHGDYERVPYAFTFRTADSNLDFVLISVHLKPGSSGANKERRKHELTAIAGWINDNDGTEKDFIILGDMNIENQEELTNATPAGYLSLNDECVPTNTNINGPKPYDHVMYNKLYTKEIDEEYDFKVVNLILAMKPFWGGSSTDAYPGDPYNHNEFRKYYSDHHPVLFMITIPENDDDQ